MPIWAMMTAALDSFPGLVVKNSYVASQGWNARTEAQAALGWRTAIAYTEGQLQVDIRATDGSPVNNLGLSAKIGRPATTAQDHSIDLVPAGGAYRAPLELAPGNWLIELSSRLNPDYRQSTSIYVRDGR